MENKIILFLITKIISLPIFRENNYFFNSKMLLLKVILLASITVCIQGLPQEKSDDEAGKVNTF
jgi:hypothetical protein